MSLVFLDEERMYPETVEELDDIVVEWSHACSVSDSKFRILVAALEFMFPRWKKDLAWSKQRRDVIRAAKPPAHTAPCGYECSCLWGAQLASLSRARMGRGLVTQAVLGLRPGELLTLVKEDFETHLEPDKGYIVIVRLGYRTGTKSGREQCFPVL